MQGAGGSSGGVGQFLIGFVMLCSGFYLLLNAIVIDAHFNLSMRLYTFSGGAGFAITTGMVMIPFIFGVAIIFYNSKNVIGWLLALGSLSAMLFGVIASLHFSFRSMSAFDLIVILVLSFGGLGLFLRSLRSI